MRNKYYVTFGQVHIHRIGDTVFDKDCVAVVDAYSIDHAMKILDKYFGERYSRIFDNLDFVKMQYYPKGVKRL